MKVILLMMAVVFTTYSYSQIKIRQLPLKSEANASNNYTITYDGALNKRVSGDQLSYSRVDSIWISGDTLKFKKKGIVYYNIIPKTVGDVKGNPYRIPYFFSDSSLKSSDSRFIYDFDRNSISFGQGHVFQSSSNNSFITGTMLREILIEYLIFLGIVL